MGFLLRCDVLRIKASGRVDLSGTRPGPHAHDAHIGAVGPGTLRTVQRDEEEEEEEEDGEEVTNNEEDNNTIKGSK